MFVAVRHPSTDPLEAVPTAAKTQWVRTPMAGMQELITGLWIGKKVGIRNERQAARKRGVALAVLCPLGPTFGHCVVAMVVASQVWGHTVPWCQ